MGVNRRVIISDAARRLLSQQRGVISRAQAVEAGLSDKALSILVRDERWTRTQNGIYMRGASVPTFDQRLWIGHLLAGDPSAIGGSACLFAQGIGREPSEVDVWVPPDPWRSLPQPFRVVRDGRRRLAHARGTLPLIRLEDALLDGASHHSLEAFVGNVTDAVRLGRTTPKRVETVLRHRDRQRDKTELLEVLADLQGIESNLEFIFRRDVERAHGLPKGLRQVKRGRSRFDILYEPYGVIAEVDGERGHVDGRLRDFRRDNSHAAHLLTTFRYGSYDIRTVPCQLAGQLGNSLQLRGWNDVIKPCPSCTS